MSLDFFLDRFDNNPTDGVINVAEFEKYLEFLRGDDVEHCASAVELFNATGAPADGFIAEGNLEEVLSLATECVLDVYCGIEFTVEVGEEEFICGGEHDHDDDDHDDEDEDHDHDDDDHDHDDRRLSGDDDHDHGHGEEELEVHLEIGGVEFECEELEEEEEELPSSYSAGTWAKVLGITGGVSLLSLLGIVVLVLGFKHNSMALKNFMDGFMALALGVLLFTVFGHLAYESIELLEYSEKFGVYALVGVLIGLFLELLYPFVKPFVPQKDEFSEGLVTKEDKEEDDTDEGSELAVSTDHGATIANIVFGDFAHNFVDGLVIALAFTVCGDDPGLGVAVTLGVLLHEVPQEISDFMVLLRCGLTVFQAAVANLCSSLSAFIGAFIVLGAGNIDENTQGILLAVSTGVLAFITLAEVFPLVMEGVYQRGNKIRVVLCCTLGLIIGTSLLFLPHEHCEAGDHGHEHD